MRGERMAKVGEEREGGAGCKEGNGQGGGTWGRGSRVVTAYAATIRPENEFMGSVCLIADSQPEIKELESASV